MFELSIKEDIASAHFLREYKGKCENLHGHTWKIEVTIISDHLDKIGMVADFSMLKKKLRAFLGEMDHACLNDLSFFKEVNPTTENISKYIYTHFGEMIAPLKIKAVGVWESETSSVKYYS